MENRVYTYKHPHPSVTVDCVIFGFNGLSLQVLLIERGSEPYKVAGLFPVDFLILTSRLPMVPNANLKKRQVLLGHIWSSFIHIVPRIAIHVSAL